MKNHKGPHKESEINPQLLECMERDLGINQDEEIRQWTPPARPVIPFHSLMVAESTPLKETADATEELFTMYQKTKHMAG